MREADENAAGRNSPGRVIEIDGLRGLGALAILAFHTWPESFFWGWTRVDLFFVISGYLITKICIDYYKEMNFLKHFYLRRILRTWPLYFLCLAAVVAAKAARGTRIDSAALALHATFQQTTPLYYDDRFPFFSPALMHTWSVGIEEQFYLIWPVVVALVGPRWIAYVAGLIALNSVLVRALGVHPWTLAARCDGLAMGALVAALGSQLPSSHGRVLYLRGCSAIAALSLVALALDYATAPIPIQAHLPQSSRGAFTILWINAFFAGLVGAVVFAPRTRLFAPLRARWLRAVGMSSYGIYMWSYLILDVYEQRARSLRWKLGADVGMFLGCLAVGCLSWRLIEKPIADLKVYWPYRGSNSRRE